MAATARAAQFKLANHMASSSPRRRSPIAGPLRGRFRHGIRERLAKITGKEPSIAAAGSTGNRDSGHAKVLRLIDSDMGERLVGFCITVGSRLCENFWPCRDTLARQQVARPVKTAHAVSRRAGFLRPMDGTTVFILSQ